MKTRKTRRTPAPVSAPIRVQESPRPSWSWFYDDILFRFGARLGFTTWGIYTTLRAFVNLDKGSCHVSILRLAITWQVSRSTVKRALRRLRDFGLIRVKLTGRVAVITLWDYPAPRKIRGVKNDPSEVPKMTPLKGQKWPIEQEFFNKSSFNKGSSSYLDPSRRESHHVSNDDVKPPRLSAAERATIDFKAVMRILTPMQSQGMTGRSYEENLETALYRSGVTRARWEEIMQQMEPPKDKR